MASVSRVRNVRTRRLSGNLDDRSSTTEDLSVSSNTNKPGPIKADPENPSGFLKIPFGDHLVQVSDVDANVKPSTEELEEMYYNTFEKEIDKTVKTLRPRKSSATEDDSDRDSDAPRRRHLHHRISNGGDVVLDSDALSVEPLASPRKKSQEIKSLIARIAELEKQNEELQSKHAQKQRKLSSTNSQNVSLLELQDSKSSDPNGEQSAVEASAHEPPLSMKKRGLLKTDSAGANYSPRSSFSSIGGKFKESLKSLSSPRAKVMDFNLAGSSSSGGRVKNKVEVDALQAPVPEDCIWATLLPPPDNFSIEKLKPVEGQDECDEKSEKSESVARFVKTREAYEQLTNLAKRTNLSPVSIIDAVIKMDEVVMTPENLQVLLKCIPVTLAAMERSRNFTGTLEDLDFPDQLVVRLSKIRDIRERIELWLFKQTFLTRFYESVEKLRVVEQSITLLRESPEIRFVLEAMLHVYNALYQESAAGFELRPTLSKMLFRSNEVENENVQNYSELVVAYLKKYHPECLKFSSVIDVLKKAVFVDQTLFVNEVSCIQETLESLPDICASFEGVCEGDRFKDVLREFYIERKPLLLALNRRTQHAIQETDLLSNFYVEKSASSSWERLFQMVILMSDLLSKATSQKKESTPARAGPPKVKKGGRVGSRFKDAFEAQESPALDARSKRTRGHARAVSFGQGLG